MALQQDFFTSSEVQDLQLELMKTKEQLDNLRRGMFGRYDQVVSKMTDIEKTMLLLKQSLSNDLDTKIMELQFD